MLDKSDNLEAIYLLAATPPATTSELKLICYRPSRSWGK